MELVSLIWDTIAVGLFATNGGLFSDESWHLLGVQLLGLIILCSWGFLITWVGLTLNQLWIQIRSTKEEDIDLDICNHGTLTAYPEHEFIKVPRSL